MWYLSYLHIDRTISLVCCKKMVFPKLVSRKIRPVQLLLFFRLGYLSLVVHCRICHTNLQGLYFDGIVFAYLCVVWGNCYLPVVFVFIFIFQMFFFPSIFVLNIKFLPNVFGILPNFLRWINCIYLFDLDDVFSKSFGFVLQSFEISPLISFYHLHTMIFGDLCFR